MFSFCESDTIITSNPCQYFQMILILMILIVNTEVAPDLTLTVRVHDRNSSTKPNLTFNAPVHERNSSTKPNLTFNAPVHDRNSSTKLNFTFTGLVHERNSSIKPNMTLNASVHERNSSTKPNLTFIALAHARNSSTQPNLTFNAPVSERNSSYRSTSNPKNELEHSNEESRIVFYGMQVMKRNSSGILDRRMRSPFRIGLENLHERRIKRWAFGVSTESKENRGADGSSGMRVKREAF